MKTTPDDYGDGCGHGYHEDGCTMCLVNLPSYAYAEIMNLRAALKDALDGWEYAANYKGEYLARKHGDAEDIAELRTLLRGKADKEQSRG
jgi:hypothetical protein